jgi:hypothetical protein
MLTADMTKGPGALQTPGALEAARTPTEGRPVYLTSLQKRCGVGTPYVGALMAQAVKRTARAARAEREARERTSREESEFAADLVLARGGDPATSAAHLDADAPGVAAVLRSRMRELLS